MYKSSSFNTLRYTRSGKLNTSAYYFPMHAGLGDFTLTRTKSFKSTEVDLGGQMLNVVVWYNRHRNIHLSKQSHETASQQDEKNFKVLDLLYKVR